MAKRKRNKKVRRRNARTRYVFSYDYEDAGHGTAPELGIAESDAEARRVIEHTLKWIPASHRKDEIDAALADLKKDGHIELNMEDLAGNLMGEGVEWDDLEDLDSIAVLLMERR